MSTTDTPSALPLALPLAPPPVYEWSTLPWKQFQRRVFKLQTRIYRASGRGDVKTVHRLQRLLMKSWAAKCLAVRKVTQDNQGKKTAGVDGVKKLTPPQRLTLALALSVSAKARPVRRVWIPKPGKPEQRPLGIPTLRDRATQTLVRLALEPEWEARFEPNSYGFRPGRSRHDAIQAIFSIVAAKPRYVLDADIAACFDRIDHAALLDKLHTSPTLRRAIRGWLKAGVMDGVELSPTDEGTPQGGALSPLLANVALHGLETCIREHYPVKQPVTRIYWRPHVIRYADDFVVLHEDLAVIEEVQQLITAWLAGMSLELKPSKTRIGHTLHKHNGQVGFDFLGFRLQQFPVGKTYTGYDCYGRPLGHKTIITPSPDAQKRHYDDLAAVVARHRQATQTALVKHLNPVISGWARCYSTAVSSKVFSRMDHLVYLRLRRWARRRHPTKGVAWVTKHYWHSRGNRNWVFAAKDGAVLVRHTDTPIRRHPKVRGDASPFDGNWAYWATRLGRHPELPKRVATLLKRQQGRCARCGLFFASEDLPEVDHIVPKHLGGIDAYFNWQLLHRHCHDQKTARDGSLVGRNRSAAGPHRSNAKGRKRAGGGTHAKSQTTTVEEPDEEKSSCPVL